MKVNFQADLTPVLPTVLDAVSFSNSADDSVVYVPLASLTVTQCKEIGRAYAQALMDRRAALQNGAEVLMGTAHGQPEGQAPVDEEQTPFVHEPPATD